MADNTAPTLPAGVRRVDPIDEGGLLACLTQEVDLDDLMLALAHQDAWDNGYYYDTHTHLTSGSWRDPGEAQVGWFRKQPCNDGDHGWDVAPAEPHARGAFLGVLT